MLERLGSLFALSPGRPELGRGLRMAASMFLPIGIGELVGEPTIGLFVGIGAFLAASCDPAGPHPARAFSMTLVAIGASIAAAAGSLAGNVAWLAVALILLVVAACGFAAVLGSRATVGAFIVAIAFVVGVALPAGLCGAGRLLLELAGGGAFAIVLSIARWPLDPEQPVRTAVADGYRAGAGFVRAALGGEGSVLSARTRAYAALRVAKDAAVSSWLPGRERLPPSAQLPHVVRLGRALDGVLDATHDPERETVSEPIARARGHGVFDRARRCTGLSAVEAAARRDPCARPPPRGRRGRVPRTLLDGTATPGARRVRRTAPVEPDDRVDRFSSRRQARRRRLDQLPARRSSIASTASG